MKFPRSTLYPTLPLFVPRFLPGFRNALGRVWIVRGLTSLGSLRNHREFMLRLLAMRASAEMIRRVGHGERESAQIHGTSQSKLL